MSENIISNQNTFVPGPPRQKQPELQRARVQPAVPLPVISKVLKTLQNSAHSVIRQVPCHRARVLRDISGPASCSLFIV